MPANGATRAAGRATTRRRLPPSERLPQLLDAALEEFLARGYAGASMAGAAARAGVAKALLYHYVPGKPELFRAVVRACVQPVFAEAERLLASLPGSRLAVLERLVEMAYARVAEEPRQGGLLRLLIAESGRFPELAALYHAEVLSPALSVAEALVRAGVEAGEFDAGLAARPGLGLVLMSPVSMAGVWRVLLGPERAPPLEEMREAHLALLRRALGVQGPGGSP